MRALCALILLLSCAAAAGRWQEAEGETVSVVSPPGFFVKGLNEFTLPVEPIDKNPQSLFPGLEVFEWDNHAQKWLLAKELHAWHAYKVELPSPRQIKYKGLETDYQVDLGYGPVSYFGVPKESPIGLLTFLFYAEEENSDAGYAAWMALSPPEVNAISESAFYYNSRRGVWDDAGPMDLFEPWRAYWISNNSPGLLLTQNLSPWPLAFADPEVILPGGVVLGDEASKARVTFTCQDDMGNPMEGILVTFSTNGPGVVDPKEGRTDADGKVATTYTSGFSDDGGFVQSTIAHSGVLLSAPVSIWYATFEMPAQKFFTPGETVEVPLTVIRADKVRLRSAPIHWVVQRPGPQERDGIRLYETFWETDSVTDKDGRTSLVIPTKEDSGRLQILARFGDGKTWGSSGCCLLIPREVKD